MFAHSVGSEIVLLGVRLGVALGLWLGVALGSEEEDGDGEVGGASDSLAVGEGVETPLGEAEGSALAPGSGSGAHPAAAGRSTSTAERARARRRCVPDRCMMRA